MWLVVLGVIAVSICILILSKCATHGGYCGEIVDKTNHFARKKIKSNKIVFFTATFFLDADGEFEKSGTYRFEVKTDESGKIILSEKSFYDASCETDETIFIELQKLIVKHELVAYNGICTYTTGLPPEFWPSSLAAKYDSGEHLDFCFNNNPYAPWAKDITCLLAGELAARGKICLALPKRISVLNEKELPDEGDLIKGQTFYAQIIESKYDDYCAENDYAKGQPIVWLHHVQIAETGQIIARDDNVIPYVVSKNGNKKNLARFYEDTDESYPFGDDAWEITTNAEGKIMDAAVYKSK